MVNRSRDVPGCAAGQPSVQKPETQIVPESIASAGMVRTFQLARGCARMTVFEHLMLYGSPQRGEGFFAGIAMGRVSRLQKARLQEASWEMARRLKLDHVIDHLVGDLSGGQRKLLEIGRALMAQPRLILLDEPMAGVNPALVLIVPMQLQPEGVFADWHHTSNVAGADGGEASFPDRRPSVHHHAAAT